MDLSIGTKCLCDEFGLQQEVTGKTVKGEMGKKNLWRGGDVTKRVKDSK